MKKFRSLLPFFILTGPLFAFGQINMKADIQTAAMGTEDNWMLSVAAIMIAIGILLYIRIKRRRHN